MAIFEHDNWADVLGIDLSDPEFQKILKEIEERRARSDDYICAFGCCVWEYDPVENTIIGGYGVAGCICDRIDHDGLKLASRR